jgi:hypothetical protein
MYFAFSQFRVIFFTGTYFGSHIGTLAIETFKIINKETPQYLHDLATLKNNKYNFRYSNKYTCNIVYKFIFTGKVYYISSTDVKFVLVNYLVK